jgi:thiamine biosynthesis protein ThiS
MKIILNNRETELPAEQLTVQGLIRAMNFTFPLIVVKVNGELVKKENYDRVPLREGDRVDAIHLISGG